MSAAQACSGHFLPKGFLGREPLRKCTSQKRDNIVLIEVDSDEFGDVIILDVPESFRQKFRKKPKHVISIDDDDDGGGEFRSGDRDPNNDATISSRSPHSSSDCANGDGDSVFEGNIPVKLAKSKRTYSGKSAPGNRYGLSSDSEGCLSDCDYSDCEFMGDSLGSLHEQWEKASFAQRHDTSSTIPGNKASTSAPEQPVDYSSEEVTGDWHSEPAGQQNNWTDSSLKHDTGDTLADLSEKLAEGSQFFQPSSDHTVLSDLFSRNHDSSGGLSDVVDRDGTSTSYFTLHRCANQTAGKYSEPSIGGQFFGSSSNHKKCDSFGGSAKVLVGDCNYTQQGGDAKERSGVPRENHSASTVSESDVEKAHGTGEPPFLSNDGTTFGHEVHDNEEKSSKDHSNIVIDRQKLKETDEYKRAMEEEWASRQQQLQQQAAEARRLRNRKKAENMRLMANERRQMERLAEIRETRRKDEENLNMKDQLRAEIRKELRRLEIMCSDMSSLLRCLGIQVGRSLYPTPAEVQAAYKRACLKFHPDRFATSDLRQQVEAEEKFKLISNMKDKFCL